MYDFEERTLAFGKRIVALVKALPHNTINREIGKQCLRSGTSIGANYREANDAVGRKDFLYRLRISRKEAKETLYWLELIAESNEAIAPRLGDLVQENKELIYILCAIIKKTEAKQQ